MCERVRMSLMCVYVCVFWRACVRVSVRIWVHMYGFVSVCAGACMWVRV